MPDADHFEFDPRMSDADALMWSIEKDPLLRSTITSISILDRPPDRERMVQLVERASRVVARLRQHVVHHLYSIAPPRWEVDPNFDLSYHLRWMRAPGEGTLREVFDIAEPIAMHGFDRARPLWEFVVIEGLADGRAAVVQKVHHAITDGVGGVRLQMELLDLERDPGAERDMPAVPEPRDLGEAQRMVDAMAYELRRQMTNTGRLLGDLGGTARRALDDPVGVAMNALRLTGSMARMMRPAAEPLSPLMRDRSLSIRFDTVQLPLAEMKGAARVAGGKLNDAFVAGVAGGLRRYHAHHGVTAEALRMTMPISIRNAATANRAGNQFVPARFPVPTDIEDPIALMTAVRELVERERGEPALAMTEPMAGLLNRLPVSATTGVFGVMLKGVDFVTTNVPGPPVPVFVAGARVESQFAFGPMTGAAVNIALLSYVDEVNIGINTDPAAIPDPEVFVSCLTDSFDEICKLGG